LLAVLVAVVQVQETQVQAAVALVVIEPPLHLA
jgi:hypothetical protein